MARKEDRPLALHQQKESFRDDAVKDNTNPSELDLAGQPDPFRHLEDKYSPEYPANDSKAPDGSANWDKTGDKG
jgi:hypothetical protein